MDKEKYEKYLLPRIIEWKKKEKSKEEIEAEKVEIEVRKFLASIKDSAKKRLLESVYLNNFHYAKNKHKLQLLFNVLKAMNLVDRELFVLPPYRAMAYMDTALPIGYDQTISQPTTVARMILILFNGLWENKKLKKKEKIKVYEVGLGAGWNAAVMACVLSNYTKKFEIHSVDRINGLVKFAEKNMKKLENYLKRKKVNASFVKKIKMAFADGFEYVKGKKFDYIIFTAGIYNKEIEEKVKEIARKNLEQGGRLICPETYGKIFIFEKKGKKVGIKKTEEEYAFVPLLRGILQA